jgi:hypothetical protein
MSDESTTLMAAAGDQSFGALALSGLRVHFYDIFTYSLATQPADGIRIVSAILNDVQPF